MIDLTPLDVRNKRGDFRRTMRGYDPQEVDHFLEMVADRLDELVREKLTLDERVERMSEQLAGQEGRERAVQEALVTAQELRREIADQARREAELTRREAEDDAERIRDAAERAIRERQHELDELNRLRHRFLKTFRTLLEREMDTVRVEEERPILEDLDLDALEVFRGRAREQQGSDFGPDREEGDENTADDTPASEPDTDASGNDENGSDPEPDESELDESAVPGS